MSVACRVLVVDDEPAIRRSLSQELEAAGYGTMSAADGEEGANLARREQPDLILTDLAMPGRDGFHLIESVRRWGEIPIIVLSVRGGESDKIRALDLGADDYVVKPFSVAELMARVRAQLRRAGAIHPALLCFGELRLDLERRIVTEGVRELHLTPTEFSLIELLALHAGRPVSLNRMIDEVWNGAPGTTHDTVRVHVGALRRKLEPDPSNPRYIVTEPWVGYRFIAEPS